MKVKVISSSEYKGYNKTLINISFRFNKGHTTTIRTQFYREIDRSVRLSTFPLCTDLTYPILKDNKTHYIITYGTVPIL